MIEGKWINMNKCQTNPILVADKTTFSFPMTTRSDDTKKDNYDLSKFASVIPRGAWMGNYIPRHLLCIRNHLRSFLYNIFDF